MVCHAVLLSNLFITDFVWVIQCVEKEKPGMQKYLSQMCLDTKEGIYGDNPPNPREQMTETALSVKI